MQISNFTKFPTHMDKAPCGGYIYTIGVYLLEGEIMSLHNLVPVYNSRKENDVNRILEILNKQGVNCCKGKRIKKNLNRQKCFTAEYEVLIHLAQKRKAAKILSNRQKSDPSGKIVQWTGIYPSGKVRFHGLLSVVFRILILGGLASLLLIYLG